VSGNDGLRLTLVRAKEDAASFSPGYQAELRQFFSLVRADGTKISAVALTVESPGGGGGYTGEFFIALTHVHSPALRDAAFAWLRGRAGRKARVKVGNTESEASCPGELYGLLNLTMAGEERLADPGTDHE
jgi:hypothetical protein